LSEYELKLNLESGELYKFINWLEIALSRSLNAGIENGLTKSINKVHMQLLAQEFALIEEDPTYA
jgi:hypothetical protein